MKSLFFGTVVLMLSNISLAAVKASVICTSTNKPGYIAIVKNLVTSKSKNRNWCSTGTAQVDLYTNLRLQSSMPMQWNNCSKHGFELYAENDKQIFSIGNVTTLKPKAGDKSVGRLIAAEDALNIEADDVQFSCVLL